MKKIDLNSFEKQEILKDLEMKSIIGGFEPAIGIRHQSSYTGSNAEMLRPTQDAAWVGSTSGTGSSDGSGG